VSLRSWESPNTFALAMFTLYSSAVKLTNTSESYRSKKASKYMIQRKGMT
jgi:hypothetical protein